MLRYAIRNSQSSINDPQAGFVLYLALVVLGAISVLVTLAFTAQRLAETLPRRELRRLQARAAAVGGLELARVYVMRHGVPNPHETVSLGRDLGSGVRTNARIEPVAGWCRVAATGIFREDTVELYGVLGGRPPAFARNVVTFESSGAAVTMGARAVVHGAIAAPANEVRSEFGGEHHGRLTNVRSCGLNDTVVEAELAYVDSAFSSWTAGYSVSDSFAVKSSGSARIPVLTSNRRVLIEGDLRLETDTVDLGARELWVTGGLSLAGAVHLHGGFVRVGKRMYVGESARVDNTTFHVLGTTSIDGYAEVRANILCADSLTIAGSARILYPSFLYLSPLYAQRHRAVGQVLTVDGRARVHGTLVTGAFSRGSLVSRLVIRGRAFVEGTAYSYTNTTMFGHLTGSLYTHRSLYRSAHSVRDGCLKECRLSHFDLSGAVTPLIFAERVSAAYLGIGERYP
ncbi:MAG: hypothetical protein GF331_20105 [Chitinivibrionales bacterium]|nr:hypothetical protein [Chitinivibrionales bacterium]